MDSDQEDSDFPEADVALERVFSQRTLGRLSQAPASQPISSPSNSQPLTQKSSQSTISPNKAARSPDPHTSGDLNWQFTSSASPTAASGRTRVARTPSTSPEPQIPIFKVPFLPGTVAEVEQVYSQLTMTPNISLSPSHSVPATVTHSASNSVSERDQHAPPSIPASSSVDNETAAPPQKAKPRQRRKTVETLAVDLAGDIEMVPIGEDDEDWRPKKKASSSKRRRIPTRRNTTGRNRADARSGDTMSIKRETHCEQFETLVREAERDHVSGDLVLGGRLGGSGLGGLEGLRKRKNQKLSLEAEDELDERREGTESPPVRVYTEEQHEGRMGPQRQRRRAQKQAALEAEAELEEEREQLGHVQEDLDEQVTAGESIPMAVRKGTAQRPSSQSSLRKTPVLDVKGKGPAERAPAKDVHGINRAQSRGGASKNHQEESIDDRMTEMDPHRLDKGQVENSPTTESQKVRQGNTSTAKPVTTIRAGSSVPGSEVQSPASPSLSNNGQTSSYAPNSQQNLVQATNSSITQSTESMSSLESASNTILPTASVLYQNIQVLQLQLATQAQQLGNLQAQYNALQTQFNAMQNQYFNDKTHVHKQLDGTVDRIENLEQFADNQYKDNDSIKEDLNQMKEWGLHQINERAEKIEEQVEHLGWRIDSIEWEEDGEDPPNGQNRDDDWRTLGPDDANPSSSSVADIEEEGEEAAEQVQASNSQHKSPKARSHLDPTVPAIQIGPNREFERNIKDSSELPMTSPPSSPPRTPVPHSPPSAQSPRKRKPSFMSPTIPQESNDPELEKQEHEGRPAKRQRLPTSTRLWTAGLISLGIWAGQEWLWGGGAGF
ncbi:uncharacterized protein SPPG_04898 [Spizellomyces punctatus DAOM BR117]|uniref:Uncharacterized protein n=1 Tax=Spizellomyces punctatus (strain DAOM BR117) TaxID=645134 RepID=A0A0L0HDE7_SPIPD|nr:uncharacterized protein SPPG_04898 [Spizellomyces punctatus DAOM BR117]KNC99505.1 hypothetical protein SPPG_04898 [Spizellomyces punctatus DAOM BR117]|eukprot:XP_016607545.1 hypothetical protein SPPG_04898 [Spizellomyces punctatus DAOM BR117]